MRAPETGAELAALLARHGFVAAAEEAAELLDAAAGDRSRLDAMLARRLTGEPLAWIVGSTTFCGVHIRVEPGVYVPRRQTEALARRALARLPETGVALDLCTGSGAIARVLALARPTARVVGVDLDARAVACAAANGVEAHRGDLEAGVPEEVAGRADVLVAVVPYVPTADLGLLQRDTLAFEQPLAYDGGPDGTRLLRRVVRAAPQLLRPGGALLLELGAGQPELLAGELRALGFADAEILRDEEGDVRGIEALLASRPGGRAPHDSGQRPIDPPMAM